MFSPECKCFALPDEWQSTTVGQYQYRRGEGTVPEFSTPDIDPELALPLGQIIIRWSTLEYLLSLLLGTFLNADQGGMTIITNNIAVSVQSKWLRALMARHPHEAEHNNALSS